MVRRRVDIHLTNGLLETVHNSPVLEIYGRRIKNKSKLPDQAIFRLNLLKSVTSFVASPSAFTDVL